MCVISTAAIVATAAVAGAATTGYTAYQQAEAAKDAADNQRAVAAKQMELADLQRAQYQDYFVPLEQQLAGQAMSGLPVELLADRATADVRTAFDQGQEDYGNYMGRRGVDVSSPAYADQARTNALVRAAAEAGTRTRARSGAIGENWNRQLQAANLGRGLESSAVSGLSSAAGMYGAAGNANMGLANAYGQQAGSLAGLAVNPQVGQAVNSAWNWGTGLFGGTGAGSGTLNTARLTNAIK